MLTEVGKMGFKKVLIIFLGIALIGMVLFVGLSIILMIISPTIPLTDYSCEQMYDYLIGGKPLIKSIGYFEIGQTIYNKDDVFLSYNLRCKCNCTG